MYDVVIIGAGVSGSACARELSKYNLSICVVEKEEDVCCGTSKANSAIVHSGIDCKTGTLMAQMNIRGNEMMDELSDVRQVPQGTLRIISSFGFGRRVVAPALSALALQYPQLELRFDVQDRLVDLVNEGVDLDIRVGDDIAPNLIARQLAANHRVLCASPQFLARHPPPKQLSDLAALPCLVIKERDHPFGIWQLHSKEGQHAIKVTGPLSSNHGEIVHQWCLDGQGIALRSWWDVRENIASGHLVHVLPEFFQPANVWAVYVSRLATSAKIRTTVEFLRHYFQQHYPQHEPTASAVGRGD